jgi:hypothetical protein
MLHVLIYETDSVVDSNAPAALLLQQVHRLSINNNYINGTMFGQGQGFVGFGSKFNALLPVLQTLPSQDFVVVADSRDVLVNSDNGNIEDGVPQQFVEHFHRAYDDLMSASTHSPNAIVISAESQCCVSALSHVPPGSYYKSDGTRSAIRACLSGTPGCLWKNDTIASKWEDFMSHVAATTSRQLRRFNGNRDNDDTQPFDDKFLNAGLIAGSVANLRSVLQDAQIGVDEDDQAVLTDYFYYNPDMIVLDYEQTMFGSNRLYFGESFAESCPFTMESSNNNELSHVGRGRHLQHTKTATTPMFIHSPGGNFKCHSYLANLLGVQTSTNHNEFAYMLDDGKSDNANDKDESDLHEIFTDSDKGGENDRDLQELTRGCQYRGKGKGRRCKVRGDGLSSLLNNRTLSAMVLDEDM